MKRSRKKVEPNSDQVLRKQFFASEIRSMHDDDEEDDDKSRVLEFVISTSAPDRDGDIIEASGWELEAFKKNPVVLFAHDNRRPPIGRALNVRVEDDKLIAAAEFMDSETDPTGFSECIYRMLKKGFLRATSVGFLPKEWEPIYEDEEKREGIRGWRFMKQELLEFSVVPVPANPEALIAAKNYGIDLNPLDEWFEEALGKWSEYKNMLLVPKRSVASWHKLIHEESEAEEVESLPEEAEQKMVITYESAHPNGTPKADEDSSWDGSAEVRDAEISDLLRMCAWREDKPEDELVKTDFKLPHHRASDDNPVVWRGVAAAMAALMGARGGVDIPDDERRGVYDHLVRHYEEFDKQPPEFEAVEQQLLSGEEYRFNEKTGLPEKVGSCQPVGMYLEEGKKMKYKAEFMFGALRINLEVPDRDVFLDLYDRQLEVFLSLAERDQSDVDNSDDNDDGEMEDKAQTAVSEQVSESKDSEDEAAVVSDEQLKDVVGMLPQIVREVVDAELKAIQGRVD